MFVDGIRSEEFDDDEEDVTLDEITKYVEAISGATFEVKVLVEPTYQFTKEAALTGNINIDGEWATGRILERASFLSTSSWGDRSEIYLDGRHSRDVSGQTFYKFQFSDLETRE